MLLTLIANSLEDKKFQDFLDNCDYSFSECGGAWFEGIYMSNEEIYENFIEEQKCQN